MELCLPLLVGLVREINGPLRAFLGVGHRSVGIGLPAASVGIIHARDGEVGVVVDGLPEVGVSLVLVAVEGLLGRAGGEGEVPGDAAVVGNEFHRLGGHALDLEAGIVDEVVVGKIRPEGSGREHDEQVVTLDFELEVADLEFGRSDVVGLGTVPVRSILRLGDAPVDVYGASIAGVEDVAAVGAEGQAVVIDAEVLLLVRLCAPPLGTGGTGRAAAHVAFLGVVDAPLLRGVGKSASHERDVLVEVHDGVVDVEGLLDIVGGDAAGVHQEHPDGVVAGGGVGFLQAVTGGIDVPLAFLVLELPDGDDGLGTFGDGEGNEVGLLVHGDDRLYRTGLHYAGLGGMYDLFRGAGSERCEREDRETEMLEYVFHDCF